MSKQHTLGPWKVKGGLSYTCRPYWYIERKNTSWAFGYEPILTPRGSTRRFYNKQRAVDHCAALNVIAKAAVKESLTTAESAS